MKRYFIQCFFLVIDRLNIVIYYFIIIQIKKYLHQSKSRNLFSISLNFLYIFKFFTNLSWFSTFLIISNVPFTTMQNSYGLT